MTHEGAIGPDGKPLPYTDAEVRAMIDGALVDPDAHLVVAILEKGGDIMAQFIGPPSQLHVDALSQVLRALKRALRTARH